MTAVVIRLEADDRPIAHDAEQVCGVPSSARRATLDDVLVGPPPALERGNRIDWPAWCRLIDALARHAGFGPRSRAPRELHVLAAAPLPLMMRLGLRVGRFFAGRAIAYGQRGPVWLAYDSAAERPTTEAGYFTDRPKWDEPKPGRPGWARVIIAAGGDISAGVVRDEAEGSFSPVKWWAPALLDESNVGACLAELREAIEAVARFYGDDLLGIALYLRTPAPLAFHLGRMINLNAVRAIRVYNHHPSEGYTLAFEEPSPTGRRAAERPAPGSMPVAAHRARPRRAAAPIELALITPALIGGPDKARVTSALRATELRGLLRYWFRVAHASILPAGPNRETASIAALRTAEAWIFGSTERRSRVRVVVPADQGESREIRLATNPDHGKDRGRGYLAYGVHQRGVIASALSGHASIRFELDGTDLDAREREALERMLAVSVWLLGTVGGLGARSRKGYGSLRITPPAGQAWDQLPWAPSATPEAHSRAIEKGMDVAVAAATAFAQLRDAPRGAEAPVAALRTLRYAPAPAFIARSFPTADAAHEEIGRRILQLRGTRSRSARGEAPLPDYFTVKDYRQDQDLRPGAPPALVERAALGLPLPFQYQSLGGQKAIIELDQAPGQDRVPSPVWIRVAPLARGDFAVVLCHLPAAGDPLLGAKARLRAPDDGNHPRRAVEASRTFVDYFLREVTR
jgi:CRISPR type III-B/RAMP module RAMP protein Cmr1